MSNYNNNNNKRVEISLKYPNFSFRNKAGNFPMTQLSVSYWKNYMSLNIANVIEQDGNNYVDEESVIKATLSAKRAYKIAKLIDDFILEKESPSGRLLSKLKMKRSEIGIDANDSGTKVISISDGQPYGLKSPVLTINNLTESKEDIEYSLLYVFNTESATNTIRLGYNTQNNNSESDEVYGELSELCLLRDALMGFANTSSKAQAFNARSAFFYNHNQESEMLKGICESLGVKVGGGYKSSGGSSKKGNFNDGNNYNAPEEKVNSDEEELPF